MFLFLSKFILYMIICGQNMHKGLIFSESLLPIKYLKPCFSKGNVLGTTIVLISIFFMEIGLLY